MVEINGSGGSDSEKVLIWRAKWTFDGKSTLYAIKDQRKQRTSVLLRILNSCWYTKAGEVAGRRIGKPNRSLVDRGCREYRRMIYPSMKRRGVIGLKGSSLRKKLAMDKYHGDGTAAAAAVDELKMNPLLPASAAALFQATFSATFHAPVPLTGTVVQAMRKNHRRTLAQWFRRREFARGHAAGVVAVAAADGVVEEESMGLGKTVAEPQILLLLMVGVTVVVWGWR
ncbi:hypothetical protein PIB30_045939 [Stylosanthes scabra]|uniref:Uncharacterized protein n=1 Tax=Stylosanthes scabra TaxID=79078 RepID=A0ABU6ZF17_9FABA|nr:hypothetical protein [Stylosanthes scabra]